ncbi:MAG: SDR family oxidoreductase, partial [Tistlia sp.]
FAGTLERFGDLHILVNNAGLQRGAPFQDMTLAQWQKVIDVNLTGQFLCARAAVRHFLARGPQPAVSSALGKILCISSVHERIPWAFEANYAASKGGVSLLMQSLAQEFAPSRIRVNAIAPGAIRTPINRTAWDSPEALDRLLALIPYGRIGEPDEVAGTVLWLASDLSDYTTGATLFVDGGMALYPGFRGAG